MNRVPRFNPVSLLFFCRQDNVYDEARAQLLSQKEAQRLRRSSGQVFPDPNSAFLVDEPRQILFE